MVQRVLGFCLALSLLCLPVLADAPEPFAVGGEQLFGLTWNVQPDGTVTKVGDWPMKTLENQQLAGALYHVAKQIDAQSITDLDWAALMNLLNTYLPRIDESTSGLQGWLINIYKELNTYHRPLLSSIGTTLGSVNSSLFSERYEIPYYYTTFSDGQVHLNRSTSMVTGIPGLLSYISRNISSSIGTVAQSLASALSFYVTEPLVGEDHITAFSLLVPGQDGGLIAEAQEVNNLLDALGLLGTSLQNPLAKLQYVLASDDDIELKDSQQENEDQFKEDFTGDGGAAVKPSDIGDLADISSGFKDSFAGAGSPGDIFSVLNDQGNYGFFSQEVLNEIEPPVPAAISAEPFDVDALMEDDPEFWGQFDIDENGFCVPKSSIFDVSAYLEGLT